MNQNFQYTEAYNVRAPVIPRELEYLRRAFPICHRLATVQALESFMSQTEEFPDDVQVLRDVYMTMASQNGAGPISKWLAGASNAEMRQAGGFETGVLLEIWRRLADAEIAPFDATRIPPNPRNRNDEFDIRRIPSEFHDLSEWLRRLSPRMCEVDLVEFVRKLPRGELDKLREFSTTASGEDRLERINEWLAEADWERWDAYRIYMFTGLVDFASE